MALRMMQQHEEFEVETDKAGEPLLPFWSETVRRVVGGEGQQPERRARTLGASPPSTSERWVVPHLDVSALDVP